MIALFFVVLSLHLCSSSNSSIITSMNEPKETRTIKIWLETYHKLRLLAALTHESMSGALHRIILAELERVQREQQS